MWAVLRLRRVMCQLFEDIVGVGGEGATHLPFRIRLAEEVREHIIEVVCLTFLRRG